MGLKKNIKKNVEALDMQIWREQNRKRITYLYNFQRACGTT